MFIHVFFFLFISNLFYVTLEESGTEFLSPVLNTNKRTLNWFSFAGKTYYVDTVFKANFYKSLQFCRQQGMHLLSINSQQENDRIGKFIQDNDGASVFPSPSLHPAHSLRKRVIAARTSSSLACEGGDNRLGYGHYWTSATNLVGDNEWVWLSTGQNMRYANWYPGEPSGKNSQNGSENCVEARHWAHPSGFTWNDIDCLTERYFICESIEDCSSNGPHPRKK
ncbi:perlucin-like isoform X1 [Diorhabda sublineata]|uniref:perlucin-like isoform X1 n=1 Tax=Diorhabda sublineata TaxID=1163346 RepID=UPI0024E0F1F0|nr:perlucin-like isoform X1 [Diorhabda sublineata]